MKIVSSRAKATISVFLVIMWLPLFSCSSSTLERDKEYPTKEEPKMFHRLSHDINVIQDDLSIRHEEDSSLKNYKHRDIALRGFHAKSHGCLNGIMTILPLAERYVNPKFAVEPKDSGMRVNSSDTLFGVFSKQGHEYKILARFSNGVGFIQEDSAADVRGLAIKLLGVDGDRVQPLTPDSHPEQHTQDFLMTNNPTQLAPTAQDFMKFGEIQDSLLASLFLAKKLRSANVARRILFRNVDSLVNEQYWSDAPIRLGSTRTIKYTARPCSKNSNPVRDGDDRLTEDLRAFAATNPICFDFQVQFQLDGDKQPMEDALTEWDEDDTPFVTVARIHFPAQRLKETTGCERLRFAPWHALAAHQPVGNMNRGRESVYASSQRHRSANRAEPDEHSIDTDFSDEQLSE
jgi:hypothetical protein